MKRIILLFIAFLPVLVFSQGKRALTIEEAIQIGLQKSKSLHLSSMKVLAADARSNEMNAARLPSMRLQAGYSRLSDIDPFAVKLPTSPTPVVISPIVLNTYVTRLSVQQPLFTGFRLENSAAAADFTAQAASFDYSKDKIDLIYNIKNSYWNLYRANEVKRVIDENVVQVKAHVKDVESMMAQGLVTRNEVLKVQVQLSSSELEQIDAINGVKLAMMQLNNLLGLPLDTELSVASTLEGPTRESPAVDSLLRQALAARSDLKAAEMRIQAGEASVTAARSGWYPQVSLYGDYYYSRPNPRILPTRDEFKGTWDVGVNLSFDIWTWGSTKYQADQAEAGLSQARDACDNIKDAVALEVKQSYLTLSQAKDKVSVAERGVEQAEENYRITKNKFTAGTATNTDLLDAEVALLQANLNLTSSLVDHEMAQARVLRAVEREN